MRLEFARFISCFVSAWDFGIAPALAAYSSPPGCASVDAPSGPTFYLDAITGADANPGSSAAPLKSLQRAIDSKKFPPGSLVYLRTGYYDDITIRHYPNNVFIHVKAEPNHTPI